MGQSEWRTIGGPSAAQSGNQGEGRYQKDDQAEDGKSRREPPGLGKKPRRGKISKGRPSRRWQEKEGTTWIRKATDRRQWKTLMEGYILQWMDKAYTKTKTPLLSSRDSKTGGVTISLGYDPLKVFHFPLSWMSSCFCQERAWRASRLWDGQHHTSWTLHWMGRPLWPIGVVTAASQSIAVVCCILL